MRSKAKRSCARRRPAAPSAARRSGSSEQPRSAAASASGSRGGTWTPVTPSTTESIWPPDRRGHDRDAAGHRLERHDARTARTTARTPPRRRSAGAAASRRGRRARAAPGGRRRRARRPRARSRRASGSSSSAAPVGPAGHVQLGVGHLGERRDRVGDALALDEPAGATSRWRPGGRGSAGPSGVKASDVDPARDDADAPAVGAHPHELEDLVGARGDEPVDRARDGALDPDALAAGSCRARPGGGA